MGREKVMAEVSARVDDRMTYVFRLMVPAASLDDTGEDYEWEWEWECRTLRKPRNQAGREDKTEEQP